MGGGRTLTLSKAGSVDPWWLWMTTLHMPTVYCPSLETISVWFETLFHLPHITIIKHPPSTENKHFSLIFKVGWHIYCHYIFMVLGDTQRPGNLSSKLRFMEEGCWCIRVYIQCWGSPVPTSSSPTLISYTSYSTFMFSVITSWQVWCILAVWTHRVSMPNFQDLNKLNYSSLLLLRSSYHWTLKAGL